MRRSNVRNRIKSKPSDTVTMDPIKLQIRPIPRSANLFSKKRTKSNLLVIVALIAAALALLSFYFLFLNKSNYSQGFKKYGIVIDGGSSGTRIHVFGYRVEDGAAVFDFGDHGRGSMRVNPGLSAYADDTEAAGKSLKQLLDFGKATVPREHWGETEVRLMATAGLRLLDVGVQERILESCRRVLRASGFRFKDEWASVITGSDEGLYAWVVANHALGTLGGDPLQTIGIIELGGASAQVTFVSSEAIPPDFSRKVKFGNFTYDLYSHSFLHFGQNVAFESLRELLLSGYFSSAAENHQVEIFDPCSPKGYSYNTEPWKLSPGSLAERNKNTHTLQSRGNFSECRSAALTLLQKGKENCSYTRCYIGSTFMPELRGKFLATENFFHTSKFFGLGSSAFLSDLMMAGQQFCEDDWSKVKSKHPSLNEEDMIHYCFSSAYIVALLHDSLGIAFDDRRITVANQVGNIPLDWALGAFILQSTADLDVKNPDWIATVISNDSPSLLSLIGISIILMFIGWSISKCRKPQLKTVYDLEKGRYIVTRVSR